MSDDNKGNASKLPEQMTQLETAIAHERVLLAKAKVKHKRLVGQLGYQQLLTALEGDITRKLTKLQSQQNTLTHKSA